jgi:bifunctional DNA primase/polymerase-like protein
VEETAPVTPSPAAPGDVPRQRAGILLEHAVRYAEDRCWDVFPGTWLETVGGRLRCVCGDAGCEAPGAHPLDGRDARAADGGVAAVRRLWGERPEASVLLATGRTFDALDVPDTAGCLALARMERLGLPLGPVTCTPDGRMAFFVLPGSAAKVPDRVRRLGWSPGALDLAVRGEGDWVAAPPTRLGSRGSVQWARRPTAANRWLPDVADLLPPLAYACGREAAASRAGR